MKTDNIILEENWEKEFDKNFTDHKDDWGISVIGYGVTTRQMKNFIKKLLLSKLKEAREQTLKEVEYKSKYLTHNQDTIGGKLRLKGTRLSIDTVLEHIALGWEGKALKEAYPTFFEALTKLSKLKEETK